MFNFPAVSLYTIVRLHTHIKDMNRSLSISEISMIQSFVHLADTTRYVNVNVRVHVRANVEVFHYGMAVLGLLAYYIIVSIYSNA